MTALSSGSAPAAIHRPRSPLQKALDTKKQDIWTIWYAAQYGKIDRMKAILQRKEVLIDVQETRTNWSALHFASRYGQTEIVQMLIEHGANPNLVDWKGNSPLHLSAGWGNAQCCILILEAGANSILENNEGEMPVHVARKLAREKIADLLSTWQPLGLSKQEISEQKARLAAFVTEQEKFTKAESNEDIRLELRALESKEQTFGLHHPGLISTLWTLSSLYRQEKRLQEALAASERALFISETIYGKNHIETAITMSNVGAVLLEMKRYQECHDHLLNGHQIVVQTYGERDHQALGSLENLVICSHSAGEVDTCERYLRELLTLLEPMYIGPNDKILRLKRLLANLLAARRPQLKEALQLHRESLALCEQMYGPHHLQVTTCTDDIGRCFFLMGDFEKAEEYFTRSLTILFKIYESSHEEVQRVQNNMAFIAVVKHHPALFKILEE